MMLLYQIIIINIILLLLIKIKYIEGISINECTIGIIGCGKIGASICKGYANSNNINERPNKILVTSRSIDKVNKLKNEYPDIIEISNNNDIINNSDIIFIGLLPNVARELLPTLKFNDKNFIISMMAAVDIDELLLLTKISSNNIVRTVPLPSCSRRSGPILLYPNNEKAIKILEIIGRPFTCNNENDMKPLISMTGHISSFYELMRVSQDWFINEGISDKIARQYVSSFYLSLAESALSSNDTLSELVEEAATPGGINEQTMKYLKSTNHFNDQSTSLTSILNRLRGKK